MMSKSTWHGVQKRVIGVQCISNVSPFCWTFTRYCTNSENVGQRGFLGVDLLLGPLTQNFKNETGLCVKFSQCIWKASEFTFVLMVQCGYSQWRSLILCHNNCMMLNRLKNSSSQFMTGMKTFQSLLTVCCPAVVAHVHKPSDHVLHCYKQHKHILLGHVLHFYTDTCTFFLEVHCTC